MNVTENASEIGKELAKEAVKEAYKQRQWFKEKAGNLVKRIRKWFHKRTREGPKEIKKILLIGGGEIGTEIGLAALKEKWQVRAILSKDKSPWPIANLPYYADSPLNKNHAGRKKFVSKCNKVEPEAEFQCIYVKSFSFEDKKERTQQISYMAKCIEIEEPDVVILEDVFLRPEDWVDLCLATLDKLKNKKNTIHFLPSIENKHGLDGLRESDIFLKKSVMKGFLNRIGEGHRLLGKADQKIDLTTLSDPENDKIDDERKKIRGAIERYKKIVLKLDTTSSGHAQFVLSKISDLDEYLTEFLPYQWFRVENKFCVLERFVENKKEACVMKAKTERGRSRKLSRICYQKYDMEKFSRGRFRGLTRLVSSETQNSGNGLWHEMETIVDKISKKLRVPFLYVEFLLDYGNTQGKKTPDVYINEISHRPDDAGFVSCLSHEKDQFQLFVDSLDYLVEGNEESDPEEDDEESDYVELKGDYLCETLNPKKKFVFIREMLIKDHDPGVEKDTFRFRLYEKDLGTGDEVDYGRIIGYLWHHRLKTGEETLELLDILQEDLDQPETINLLKESLREMHETPLG